MGGAERGEQHPQARGAAGLFAGLEEMRDGHWRLAETVVLTKSQTRRSNRYVH
jgi:hypothetical protein